MSTNNKTREDALKWWNELTGSQREDYLVRYECLNNDFSMNTTVINIYKAEHPELYKGEGIEDIPVQDDWFFNNIDDDMAVVSDAKGYVLSAPDEETGKELVKRWNAYDVLVSVLKDARKLLQITNIIHKSKECGKVASEITALLNNIENK